MGKNGWLPDPLFTPEERAALVALKGEEWVAGEEAFMDHTRPMMNLIDALAGVPPRKNGRKR